MIVAGVGFSGAAAASEIVQLVEHCLDGREAQRLAVPSARATLPQAAAAAARLGVELVAIPDAALAAAQPRCLTPPGRAALSVAEGAALAAAGEAAWLLGPRVAGARVTCALATGPGVEDPRAP